MIVCDIDSTLLPFYLISTIVMIMFLNYMHISETSWLIAAMYIAHK